MKTINDIHNLLKRCTGCLACADVCPKRCIQKVVHTDGFQYAKVDTMQCIECGKCFSVCPIENFSKHEEEQKLYAMYAKSDEQRNNGSSGGIFELLARKCLEEGFYVCGSAFEGTTLKHKIIHKVEDLGGLLKSKYIQSNTEGIYKKIVALLENQEKVLFCGTPCQVSALLNVVPIRYREQLLAVDIICHGVPSQTVFNQYINTLEKKHGTEICSFSFRVKNNRFKHAHGYAYQYKKNGKTYLKNGIYSQSSFYYAFKQYLILRDSCYDCKYATQQRVSDITLADFWGIEKYDFNGETDQGVSMVITNSEKGNVFLRKIRDLTENKQFPLVYGIESNHCFTHSTQKPKNRDKVIAEINEYGYEETAKKYFKPSWKYKIYWFIPASIRNWLRKKRG